MLLLGFLCPVPVKAETLIAARTIRSQSVLTRDDVVVADHNTPGALRDPADAVGLETRVVLYAGRPVRAADIGPVTLIDRNQVIPLIFTTGGLTITTEGRALERGGIGDSLRVMNIASRTTVTGWVAPDGSVRVNP